VASTSVQWFAVEDVGGSKGEAGIEGFRRSFGGVKVSTPTRTQLVALVRQYSERQDQLCITFINPDYARRAFRNDDLREAINAFDLVLVDGNGVRWLSPLFGFRVPERLDTDSLAPHLFDGLAVERAKVFLFGCAPGVAERAAGLIGAASTNVEIVGTEHGFWDIDRGHPGRFDDSDTARIIEGINASGADLVIVSLPTPLQQTWVIKHRKAIFASVVMTGGSFLDHVADNDKWPESWYPAWANRFSLNWLYRLLHEPRRLWRRYTIEMAQFVGCALRARFTRRH